ncbi:hypothetical protein [Rhodoferax sp.]|uniref:hypothetical protein n=1 Tax=Rhodoferax sp. TaxID=50421 RepID=UPI00276AE7D2|nr:hypothetical protein [Rhodoferax sp.]
MRTILGVLSLLLVVVVVGVLTKKQLGTLTSTRLPAASTASAPPGDAGAGSTVPQQSQQLQQRIKQSVEATMQQARPEPEDK